MVITCRFEILLEVMRFSLLHICNYSLQLQSYSGHNNSNMQKYVHSNYGCSKIIMQPMDPKTNLDFYHLYAEINSIYIYFILKLARFLFST